MFLQLPEELRVHDDRADGGLQGELGSDLPLHRHFGSGYWYQQLQDDIYFLPVFRLRLLPRLVAALHHERLPRTLGN